MGLKDFLNKKLTEQKENNLQKKEAQQAGKKEYFRGYESEQKKIQSQKGREAARRDSQGTMGKIGAFADAFGQSSRSIEKSFGFDNMGFGYPPQEKKRSNSKTVIIKVVGAQGQTQHKKKRERRHQTNSLDYTQW
ncbi:MAG: hypothetical protein WC325_09775 [Candidatus Bathyarchaeia archaeon]